MRLKKSILAMVLSCLTILNVFTIPVMAAEPAASETEAFLITLQENQWNLRLSKMVIG